MSVKSNIEEHVNSVAVGVLGAVGGSVCAVGVGGIGAVAFADSAAPIIVTAGLTGAASLAGGMAGFVGTARLSMDNDLRLRPATTAFSAVATLAGIGLATHYLIQNPGEAIPEPASSVMTVCEGISADPSSAEKQVILTFPGTDREDCILNSTP